MIVHIQSSGYHLKLACGHDAIATLQPSTLAIVSTLYDKSLCTDRVQCFGIELMINEEYCVPYLKYMLPFQS